MPYVALTRASTVFPILRYLHRAGASVKKLLAMARLPTWITAEPEALIPATSPVRIFREALRESGIPSVGLAAAEETSIEALGTFGRLVRSAPTLGAALKSAVRYSTTITSNRPLSLRRRGDRVEFCMTLADRLDPRDVACQQDNLFSVGLMIGVVRLGAGARWRPTDVRLWTEEAPGSRGADSLSDAHVTFGEAETMVAIPRELLAAPLPPVPAAETPTEVADWRASAPVRDFAGSIRQAIETLSCGEGYPSIRQSADFVGMSVRTLQRRLAEAGFSHEALVAQSRFATAAAVLEESNARILDLALELGYADHANFTRAFRHWAGCSPKEYRVRHGRRRRVRKAHRRGDASVYCVQQRSGTRR
jgi:AraC-like DNA-binding protein